MNADNPGLVEDKVGDLLGLGAERVQACLSGSGDALRNVVQELDTLLRHEHAEDYCGIVYTDSMNHPTYIKVFDPNNLGSTCGSSGNPPLPGWILSHMQPINLPAALPQPGNRRRWWQKLFNHAH